jgi:hypothetical protein
VLGVLIYCRWQAVIWTLLLASSASPLLRPGFFFVNLI